VSKISFGTDGWRAIISDGFTFENVRIVAQSIADYVKTQKTKVINKKSEVFGKKASVVVGYDTRFMSEKYAEIIACVLAGNGIKVVLSDRSTPTPSVSFYIPYKNFIGGVMVTASHNPAMYNGIKYKCFFGGSVGKDVTNYMESRLYKTRVKSIGRDEAIKKGLIRYENILDIHIAHIKKYANLRLLKNAGLKILVDSMNGTGARYIEDILKGTNNMLVTINSQRDPYFGGRSPEPNEIQVKATSHLIRKGDFDVGLVTDGDADRLGVMLPDGKFLTGHKVMTLLLLYLLEDRKLSGGVVQTICGTGLIDKIAGKYGLKTYETAVGFKYIGDIYYKEDILLGGEETGGVAFKGWLPERDGILSGLLILELMASRKESLTNIITKINKTYGIYVYKRFDMRIPRDKKKVLLTTLARKPFGKILGKSVIEVKSYDGFKFILEDGTWLMLRASGTEPKLRIYSEGHSDKEALRLIEFGKRFAQGI